MSCITKLSDASFVRHHCCGVRLKTSTQNLTSCQTNKQNQTQASLSFTTFAYNMSSTFLSQKWRFWLYLYAVVGLVGVCKSPVNAHWCVCLKPLTTLFLQLQTAECHCRCCLEKSEVWHFGKTNIYWNVSLSFPFSPFWNQFPFWIYLAFVLNAFTGTSISAKITFSSCNGLLQFKSSSTSEKTFILAPRRCFVLVHTGTSLSTEALVRGRVTVV